MATDKVEYRQTKTTTFSSITMNYKHIIQIINHLYVRTLQKLVINEN